MADGKSKYVSMTEDLEMLVPSEEDNEKLGVTFENKTVSKKCVVCLSVVSVVLIILLLAATIGLAVALGITLNGKSNGSTSTGGSDVCTTRQCAETATLLFQGLNESVDPCEDFYQFVCGNWIQNNYVDPATPYQSSAVQLQSRNRVNMKRALTERKGREVEAVRKLQDFYFSCLNVEIANSLGVGPLINLIAQTGGWDLVNIPGDGSTTQPWSLDSDQFREEKLRGSPAFFTIETDQDHLRPTRFIISVKNSGFTFMDNITTYSNDSALESARTIIANVLQTISPMEDNTSYIDAADQIMSVEKELSKIYQDPSKMNAFTYPVTTLGNLAALWPEYDLVGNTQILFTAAGTGITDIGPDEPVRLASPLYFRNLSSVLNQFNDSVLTNYAKWQVVYNTLQYLDTNCVAAFVALKKLANPTQPSSLERGDQCIAVVEKNMPLALGRVFAEFILPPESIPVVTSMTTAVMKAFREGIGTRDWLDEPTIKRAQTKIDLMRQMIAYPDVTFKDAELNAVYAGYTISSTNLFENYYQFLVNGVSENLAQLRTEPNIWTFVPPTRFPTTTNAFFYQVANTMYILEGIMGSPYFNHEWPLPIRYGALGSVIGHEITHGFDSTGRLFNETGQLDIWWTNQSVNNFVERQQCFVDQYSLFSDFNISLSGQRTLAENIADAGGLAAGYRALKDSGAFVQTLPGLKYNTDQLYFIGFSQLWCEYVSNQDIWIQLIADSHSPGRFRAIGTLQNSEEFSKAFGCKKGSQMNPEKKCSLW